MTDPSTFCAHKTQFLELQRAGELYALNSNEENLDSGPWIITCKLADSDAASRLKERFRSAVRAAALAAGAPDRICRIDWWVRKLAGGKRLQHIDELIRRSAEYCEILENSFLELGLPAASLTGPSRLFRDRYPCDFGEPYFLYDGPRRDFEDPTTELEYWKEHIWEGFSGAVLRLAEVGSPRKRQPGESRGAYRYRLKERIEFLYINLNKTIRGLSYDLAVLYANNIIDRSLCDDRAVRTFQEESTDLIERVKAFWREGSKRLGLSYRKQERQVLATVECFQEVAEDLRRLLSANRLAIGRSGAEGDAGALMSNKIPISGGPAQTALGPAVDSNRQDNRAKLKVQLIKAGIKDEGFTNAILAKKLKISLRTDPPAPITHRSGETNAKAANEQEIAARAARRKVVVMPILESKRWNPGRLATEAGVGKNSVYNYLDGTRAKITPANREAIAGALDLPPDQLPD